MSNLPFPTAPIQVQKTSPGTPISMFKYQFAPVDSKETQSHPQWKLDITKLQPARIQSISNVFHVVPYQNNRFILVCHKAHNTPELYPPIMLFAEYVASKKKILIRGDYFHIRALFTMNSIDDSLGWLSELSRPSVTIEIRLESREFFVHCTSFGLSYTPIKSVEGMTLEEPGSTK